MGTVACNVYGPWLLPPVIIGCVTCHLCPNYSNFGALQSSLSHLLMQERRPLGENPLLLQLSIICSTMLESPGMFPMAGALSCTHCEDTQAHAGQSDPVFSNCQDLGVGSCAEYLKRPPEYLRRPPEIYGLLARPLQSPFQNGPFPKLIPKWSP